MTAVWVAIGIIIPIFGRHRFRGREKDLPIPAMKTVFKLTDALCYAFWVGALAVIVLTPITVLAPRP